jgi:hypothetical protein
MLLIGVMGGITTFGKDRIAHEVITLYEDFSMFICGGGSNEDDYNGCM